MSKLNNGITEQMVVEFYNAALFLKERVEKGGWKSFSSNYLREHVRCKSGLKFSNSLSPEILREVIRRHPGLKQWIEIGPLK